MLIGFSSINLGALGPKTKKLCFHYGSAQWILPPSSRNVIFPPLANYGKHKNGRRNSRKGKRIKMKEIIT